MKEAIQKEIRASAVASELTAVVREQKDKLRRHGREFEQQKKHLEVWAYLSIVAG